MSNGKFYLHSDRKDNDFFQAAWRNNYDASSLLNGATPHKSNTAVPILSYLWEAKQA